MRELEGGCQVPIGVNTQIEGEQLILTGLVASLDGKKLVKDIITGTTADAEKIGIELAQKLRKQGAQEILDKILAEIDRS